MIRGGSSQYLGPLMARFREQVRLSCPVQEVHRQPEGVVLTLPGGHQEHFDAVVLAVHSDQALRLLADASPQERAVLGAIPYQENQVVLHTDSSWLPRRRAAWSSWNYLLPPRENGGVAVTYHQNRLQSLKAPVEFCVTLNPPAAIPADAILRQITYHHPIYTAAGFAAQKRWSEINGVRRTYFCGAYWGYGFHEDGVNSALAVGRLFGVSL